MSAEPFRMLCRECYYPLHGLTENRCPECGRAFDPEDRRTFARRRPRRWRWEALAALGCLVLTGQSLVWMSDQIGLFLRIWRVPGPEFVNDALHGIVLFAPVAFAVGFGLSALRRGHPVTRVVGGIVFAVSVFVAVSLWLAWLDLYVHPRW